MERSNNLTRQQVQEIIRLYPDRPASVIAEQFGKPVSHIYKIAYRYGVKKSEAFRNSTLSGRIQKGQRLSPDTEFKKGLIPKTKGRKLADIRKNKEALERTISTRWKKGHKPYSTKYDCAITVRRMRLDKTGGVIPYQFIRISEGRWEFFHRHLWKKHYGNIPQGYNVVFKDGNTLNCVIENLECISNTDLLLRNQIHNLPKEVKDLVYLKASLTKAINKATNNGNNRKTEKNGEPALPV